MIRLFKHGKGYLQATLPMKRILKQITPGTWSVERWSPGYVRARIAQSWFRLRNPDYPWLTKESIGILNRWIRPGHSVVEFGSGGSTLYFAARCGRLVSYEHDENWYRKVSSRLNQLGYEHVDAHCFALKDPRYCDHVCSLADQSIDLVLIDGRRRAECTWNALPKLKPKGLLVIDNAERYLTRDHNASLASGAEKQSPTSSEDIWRMVAGHTASWKRQWTDNGIWTTLILHCP